MEAMGHADLKTTMIYSHYAPDPTNGKAYLEKARALAHAPAQLTAVVAADA